MKECTCRSDNPKHFYSCGPAKDCILLLKTENARLRSELKAAQELRRMDAESFTAWTAKYDRLRETLEYAAQFAGHHYAPLRAVGEMAQDALKK